MRRIATGGCVCLVYSSITSASLYKDLRSVPGAIIEIAVKIMAANFPSVIILSRLKDAHCGSPYLELGGGKVNLMKTMCRLWLLGSIFLSKCRIFLKLSILVLV